MKFGKNTDVNYKAPIVTTTTQTNPKLKTQVNPKTIQVNKPKTPSVNVVSEILGVTMMIGD